MRYFIITPVPFSVTEGNQYAVADLWGWDLEAHLGVFSDLHIIAPLSLYDKKKFNYIFPKETTIIFHPLRDFKNPIYFFYNVLRIISIFNSNIKKDDIVHFVGTGIPPLVIVTNILCLLTKHKKRIFVLDADLIGDLEIRIRYEKRTLKKSIFVFIKHFSKIVFKIFISTSPITFVVGNTLYEKHRMYKNVVKIHASWVKEKDIISSTQLKEKLENILNKDKIRIIFAASLVVKKGPNIAVEVVKILKARNIPVTLDIYGEGPMWKELNDLINAYDLLDTVYLKGIVPYGAFYHVLRQYDTIIVPNLSGEQPRIIFDAMANGVAVIGSDIQSFNDIISNGENGLLFIPERPEDFANAVEKLYRNRKLLEKLIYSGIETARMNTIESMHKRREQIIKKIFIENERT